MKYMEVGTGFWEQMGRLGMQHWGRAESCGKSGESHRSWWHKKNELERDRKDAAPNLCHRAELQPCFPNPWGHISCSLQSWSSLALATSYNSQLHTTHQTGLFSIPKHLKHVCCLHMSYDPVAISCCRSREPPRSLQHWFLLITHVPP